ncbi:MAG: hypothetical protein V3S31_00735 [Dehalococcoidia bacterium]
MPEYTYATSLENAYRVNWRIEDVLGDSQFDTSRPWLPSQLSGAAAISCLNDEEQMKLTHIEMGAYAHIFGFVEEFITPTMVNLAQAVELEGVARFVLSKKVGAVFLLTEAIEWFTQLHYLSGFKDDETLDPLTRAVFKAHWQEEAQHAHLDHLEILREFGSMTDAEKDEAIDDLIELVGAVDGLLQEQVKRDTFIESGVTHKNFLETFAEVTTSQQQEKVETALGALLQS